MTQDRVALTTTISIWAVFLIVALFLPMPKPEEKKLFGEMSIRLEPLTETQTESMQRESTESFEQTETAEVATTMESQAPVREVEPVKESVVPQVQQASVAKPTETPQPRREQVLAKSIEELMAEQNNRTQSNAQREWSDDIFSSSSAVSSTTQSSSTQAARQSTSSLSGSAASSASSAASGVVTEGESARSGVATGTVSSQTSDLLSGIANAQSGSTQSQQSTSSSSSTQTSTSSQAVTSGYNFTFEGEQRRLIYPTNPVLVISPENQRLVSASREVTVTLTVSANGTVSPSSVTFTPSALVPSPIQGELRQQIVTWRFEEGSSSGQASFFYSIIVE